MKMKYIIYQINVPPICLGNMIAPDNKACNGNQCIIPYIFT